MNLDVMKTFCGLVDSGSFSKAAEANYISQSAVSQQLAKLEQELQTQLINRDAGETPARLADGTSAPLPQNANAPESARAPCEITKPVV